MTLRRFLIWLAERAVELHLAVAGLLAVKFLLPTAPQSYTGLAAFVAGVRETLRAGLDDAAFLTRAFMNGDWALYAWKTYLASAWVIGFCIYLQGLYLFTALLARRLAPDRPVRGNVMAFLVSFAVLCVLHAEPHDAGNLRLALCLLVGGTAIAAVSGLSGRLLSGRPAPRPVRAIPLRGPLLSGDLADVAAPAPSMARRERLYFSD